VQKGETFPVSWSACHKLLQQIATEVGTADANADANASIQYIFSLSLDTMPCI